MTIFKKFELNKRRRISADNYTKVILLFIVIIFGSILRIYKLGSKSLWYDEIGQVLVSKNTIPEVLKGVTNHLSPPLDYIILHFFLYFGNSEFIARLPSALFGILAIILIYKVGIIMFGTKEGLISAFLLSISPMHIWYSQEARMYSLFTFLSLLSLFFFYKSIKGNENKMWAGFIFSTVLCVYTHYFAFFIMLIEMLFLLFLLIKNKYSADQTKFSCIVDKKTLLTFVFGIVIILLLFVPWLNIFLNQTHGLQGIIRYGLQPDLYFFYDIFSSISVAKLDSLLYMGIFFSIFLYGVFSSIKKCEDQIILLFLWVTVPVVVSFVLSYFRGPMTTERNMIFILPVYLIIIARGITSFSQSINQLTNRLTRKITFIDQIESKELLICSIIMLLLVSISFAAVERGYRTQKDDYRGAGYFLNTQVKDTDLIVVLGDYTSLIVFYYEGNAEIMVLFGDITCVDIVNISPNNYTKLWFVSSPHFGVSQDLLNCLNSNFRLERVGSAGRLSERGAIYSRSIAKEAIII